MYASTHCCSTIGEPLLQYFIDGQYACWLCDMCECSHRCQKGCRPKTAVMRTFQWGLSAAASRQASMGGAAARPITGRRRAPLMACMSGCSSTADTACACSTHAYRSCIKGSGSGPAGEKVRVNCVSVFAEQHESFFSE